MSKSGCKTIWRVRCLLQTFTLPLLLAPHAVKAQTISSDGNGNYIASGPNSPGTTSPNYRAKINSHGVLVSYKTLNPTTGVYSEFFHASSTAGSDPDGVLFNYTTDFNGAPHSLASNGTPPPHITCKRYLPL